MAINILTEYIMQTIKVTTLIDITNTGVSRPDKGDERSLNQYRNWTTLMQCIGLRCIIDYERNPKQELIDVKGLGFGNKFKGTQAVWTFVFHTDRDDVYQDKEGPLSLLINDLHDVPIIKNLNESINIDKASFDLFDQNWKNTQVVLLTDATET